MLFSNIIQRFNKKKICPYTFTPTIRSNDRETTQQKSNNEIPDVIHIPAMPYYKFSYLVKEQSIRTLQKITPIELVHRIEKKTLDDYDEIIKPSDSFDDLFGYDYCNDIPLEELNEQPAFVLDDYGPPPPYNACHGNPPRTLVRAIESSIPTPSYTTI